MQELLYRIALTKIPKVGAITAKNLVSHCGSAQAVFSARKKELIKIPGVADVIADCILQQDVLAWAEDEYRFIEKNAIRPIFHTDKDFPMRLKSLPDAPFMLYAKGNADFNVGRIVAIVGTRSPSPHGKAICEEIVENLIKYNPLFVSGLAYGIDFTAHRKCVDMKIPNIAVLGNGLKSIYPKEHHAIALKIAENGALITEFPADARPEREHFPMRNRIIAGMADAVIVIESGAGGGSIITADLANAYNRDVFAVPGRPADKYSQGCNRLIKNNKAALVENAEDIASFMQWEEGATNKPGKQTALFLDLTQTEQDIFKILSLSDDPIVIDSLIRQSGLHPSQTSAVLLSLEFKGLVRSLPGKRYAAI